MVNRRRLMALWWLVAGHGALADAHVLKVKPGNWEVVSSTVSPFTPEPQQYRFVQCVREEELDVQKLMQEQYHIPCVIKDMVVSPGHLAWRLECQNPLNSAVPVHGEGSATVKGDSGNGTLMLNMDMPGLGPGEFRTTWNTKRLGDC